MRGPWQAGKPQQGYQLPLTPEQFFKAGIEAANVACAAKYGKPFDQISAADANRFLSDRLPRPAEHAHDRHRALPRRTLPGCKGSEVDRRLQLTRRPIMIEKLTHRD